MAGDKVNNYSQVDSDILALQLTTDKTFKGYHQLTLTNYDNTTVPAIAAGSAIECNGALYKFDSEEAISTTDPVTSAAVADGTVYVCIIPGATTCTAAFTATAPTWSDTKNGWYGTGGQANYRYVTISMTKATSSYSNKIKFTYDDNILLDSITTDSITTDSITLTTSSKVLAYLSGGQTINSNNPTKITFNSEYFDTQSEFDVSTNTFTATKAGYYLVSGIITLTGTPEDQKKIFLYKDGSVYPTGCWMATTTIGSSVGSQQSFNFTIVVYLDINGTISIYADSTNSNPYTVTHTGTFLSITSLV